MSHRYLKRSASQRVSNDDAAVACDQVPGPDKATFGGKFKSAAVAVLRLERRLMTTGDITRLAIDKGLLKCHGRTPEATMASALYTDVKRKNNTSVFTRPQEGLFGLREWAPLQPDTRQPPPSPTPAKRRAPTPDTKPAENPPRSSRGEAPRPLPRQQPPPPTEASRGRAASRAPTECLDSASDDDPYHEVDIQALRSNILVPVPRLPAEDRLAALHEIATSPLSYAPSTAVNSNSSRPVASGGPQHKKPRLVVDVMEGQVARKTSAATTPTSQLLDAIGTPHTKDGQDCASSPLNKISMMLGLHVSSPTLPSLLESLNSQAALSVPLFDSLAPTPRRLAEAAALQLLQHHTHQDLFTSAAPPALPPTVPVTAPAPVTHSRPQLWPAKQQLRPAPHPRTSMMATVPMPASSVSLSALLPAQLQLLQRQQQLQLQGQLQQQQQQQNQHQHQHHASPAVGESKPPVWASKAAVQHHNPGAPAASNRGRRSKSKPAHAYSNSLLAPTAAQGGELKDLGLLEERVETLQQELGTGHPQVGKAWVLLSRLYQVQSVCPAKAQYSLQRAWQVRNACAARSRLPASVQEQGGVAFQYLMSRYQGGKGAHK